MFDFPKAFQHDWAGWLGRQMVDEYVRFAQIIFTRFRGRVQTYFSFHEPNSLCASYPTGGRFVGPRPNVNDSSVEDPARDHYTCMYYVLLGHGAAAAAMRAIDPAATLSMISDGPWVITNTTSSEDAAARDRVLAWHYGAYFEPLVTGDWPPEMRAADPTGDRIPVRAAIQAHAGLGYEQGHVRVARGEPFEEEAHPGRPSVKPRHVRVRVGVRGAAGIVGVAEKRGAHVIVERVGARKIGARGAREGAHSRDEVGGVEIHAQVCARAAELRRLCGSEEGNPLSSGVLAIDVNDTEKVAWLTQYYAEAHAAIVDGGVDLRGIFLWSFLDNLEWDSGYAAHFGIVHVNHTLPSLERTPKLSAEWFKGVVENHGFDVPN